MALWAVVPVKPLSQGKSRLAGILEADERMTLNRCFLENTLEILQTVSEIEHVLVVSRDPQVLAISRRYGAYTLMEQGGSNLNLALTRASIVVRRFQARELLVVPTDLPMLSKEDLQVMIRKSETPPVVVIVPDRRHEGTNALLISPVGVIAYSFGKGSLHRHCEMARQVGARLEVCELPLLALDVDTPEDLELVQAEVEDLVF